MPRIKVGIFGATGSVGRELINVISKRGFPAASLRLFASEKSAGKKLETPLGSLTVESAAHPDFSSLDLAFFAVGGGWSKEQAPKANEAGCHVIDNSSAFRYDEGIPLVITQINAGTIGTSMLIANPNCTTAIAALPLWGIYRNYGLKKVIISTYQAASGAGSEGMKELEEETRNYLEGKKVSSSVFPHPLPFNIIPHIDSFQANHYTREEMKVVWETRKIFGDEKLQISCTCVRIPTMRAHAESITVETEKKIDADEARLLLAKTNGVQLRDDVDAAVYPMPLTASSKFEVEVGRVRQNLIFGDYGLDFFVCGDQLLRGAALNAVEIAEELVKRGAF